jgi:hypothetical protein
LAPLGAVVHRIPATPEVILEALKAARDGVKSEK